MLFIDTSELLVASILYWSICQLVFYYWALFQLLALKPKYASMHAATSIALFWGMIGAIVSCISGYLLSQSGDYDEELVKHINGLR